MPLPFALLLAPAAAALTAPSAFVSEADQPDMQSRLEELKGRLEGMHETQLGLQSDVEGLKKLKVSGYVQARGETHQDRPANATTGTSDRQDGFYIRRGRVKFTYTAGKTSQVVVYPDLSSKDGVTLKEGYVKLTEPWSGLGVNLVFGQQNWFFGREIERSSGVREFPERARVFGKAVFDGERDKGARLEFPNLLCPGLNVKIGLFNGNGIKTGQSFDNDPHGHWMGRVAYSLGWLDLGVSGEYGDRFAKTAAATNGAATKKHVGADAFLYYELPALGGGSFGGEWLKGEGVQDPATLHAKNEGWFVSAVQNIGAPFQVAARFDAFDPDLDKAGDRIDTTVLAAHWLWDDNVRLTLAWEAPVTETSDPRDNTVTLQFQHRF